MTETKKKSKGCAPSSDVIRIYIDKTKCNACGLCGEVCPFGLPSSDDSGKFQIKNPELCTECSACQRNCPTQAVMMNEQQGCGCLWDARQRKKANKSGILTSSSCCCGPVSNDKSCCAPTGSQDFDIKVLDTFNSFIKPNLTPCCGVPEEIKSEKKEKEKIPK